MNRKATAVWRGTLKTGQGWLTSESGALEQTPYSFTTRFEEEPGTNPEELIAAAHSGCFTMALAANLSKQNYEPKKIETVATVSLKKDGESWTVATSHLHVSAEVSGLTKDEFESLANDAKENCPISRLLNAEISMETVFEEDLRHASDGDQTAPDGSHPQYEGKVPSPEATPPA